MEDVYLLLGSNLGDREKYISKALELIRSEIGSITGLSSLYQTAAWGNTQQPDFVNQVVKVITNLNPQKLLNSVLVIESKIGRTRIEKWSARTIDIDILFYGDQVISLAELVVPHPYLHQRRFTLMPLIELDADLVHPVLKQTVTELYNQLDDNLSVVKL